MFIIKHTVTTKASAQAVWALYEDPKTCSQWEVGHEWWTQDGPLVRGTRGTVKPIGSPVIHWEVTEATQYKHFTTVSQLPLTKLIFVHTLKQEGDLLHITHEVNMTGLLAWFFALVSDIKKNVPVAMEKLARLAEATEGK